MSETASLGESPRANGSATPSNHEPSRKPAEGAAAEADVGSMPEMTPEEIAFMRSLGWEDTGDDAEGNITPSQPSLNPHQDIPLFPSQAPGPQHTFPVIESHIPGIEVLGPCQEVTLCGQIRSAAHSCIVQLFLRQESVQQENTHAF